MVCVSLLDPESRRYGGSMNRRIAYSVRRLAFFRSFCLYVIYFQSSNTWSLCIFRRTLCWRPHASTHSRDPHDVRCCNQNFYLFSRESFNHLPIHRFLPTPIYYTKGLPSWINLPSILYFGKVSGPVDKRHEFYVENRRHVHKFSINISIV